MTESSSQRLEAAVGAPDTDHTGVRQLGILLTMNARCFVEKGKAVGKLGG